MAVATEVKTHHIVSLGAGVQSSTMLLMAIHGEITPKPELAIFADTGWEPQRVYDWLGWLTEQAERAGIPILKVSKGNIRDDFLQNAAGREVRAKRFVAIPFHLRNKDGSAAMARRQCTREYKIEPIHKATREYLGYQPRQVIRDDHVIQWRGISVDEIARAKDSRDHWITVRYPLIELGMNRIDCLMWMERHDYPRPPKSSCIGCPYHSNEFWMSLKSDAPHEFAEAVEFDEAIRKQAALDGEAYVHRSLTPLNEVDLRTNAEKGQTELDLFDNECEGMCGL